MKRSVLTILLVVIMFIFSGCSARYSTDTNIYSDNLELKTEFEVYSVDVSEIKFKVKNVSDEEQAFGFKMHLLKNVEGEWKIVEYQKDVYWNDLAQVLESGAKTEKTMKLSEWYRLPLQKGEYKVVLSDDAVSNSFKIE